jgi:hypothetical protein
VSILICLRLTSSAHSLVKNFAERSLKSVLAAALSTERSIGKGRQKYQIKTIKYSRDHEHHTKF